MTLGPAEDRGVPASKRLYPRARLRIARPFRHLVGHPETLNHYLTVAKRRERLGGSKHPIQRTLLACPKEGGQIESAGRWLGGLMLVGDLADSEIGFTDLDQAVPALPRSERGSMSLVPRLLGGSDIRAGQSRIQALHGDHPRRRSRATAALPVSRGCADERRCDGHAEDMSCALPSSHGGLL